MSDVHRHHPELSAEIERTQRAELLSALAPWRGEFVERDCRDCGTAYTVPADKARSGSKWYSRCPSCLYWEI